MRILVTFLAVVLSGAVTAVAVFFAVLVLAGPHGGILPSSLQTFTLVLGWCVVVAVPALVARWAWRRFPGARK